MGKFLTPTAYPYPELRQQILFLDVGYNTETHFHWINAKTENPFAPIDVIAARSFPGDLTNYIHLQRKENKLAFRLYANPACGFKKLIFVIGATGECQYQVIEAFLEYLATKWYEQFGSFPSTPGTWKVFDPFVETVEQAFEEIPKSFLMKVKTHCKICNDNFGVYVRKSLVDGSSSYPVALVFQHANHALLIYIDDKYQSRGESVVNITG